MTKVQVSIEYNFIGMDDAAAKAHARSLVEGRGLIVAGTKVLADKGAGKEFTPKAGKPGSIVMRAGRAYQVWSEGRNTKSLWIVPVDRQEGDAAVYETEIGGDNYVTPCHGDGTTCRPSGGEACRHRSHEIAA
jgi:hypothetical protein